MANAAAYATLALGLNIVVGFAGLLDLGYAAFFAIGAYFYGIFTALPGACRVGPTSGSRSPRSAWSRRSTRAARTWCISRCRSGSRCRSAALRRGVLRRAVRRADAAAARRLSRHRHARLRRDRADRGAQRRQRHQRRRRAERRAGAAAVRPQFRRRCDAVLLRRHGAGGAADLRLASACATAASAAPGWRSARTRPRPAPWAST